MKKIRPVMMIGVLLFLAAVLLERWIGLPDIIAIPMLIASIILLIFDMIRTVRRR